MRQKNMKTSPSLQSFPKKSSTFSENNVNLSLETMLHEHVPMSVNTLSRKRGEKEQKKNQVFLEGYVDANEEDVLTRIKSLTDDDLEELKGCLDLGFGFNYDEIPGLCNTLPALELCYSMSQKYLDEQHRGLDSISDTAFSASPSSIPIWKISSPGDDPEDVKARLKYWAQAVACTVKLCSWKENW